ncbi:hypothetical protein ATY41_00850 [Leifsonia xyli subsp. xyli]|uniref:Uncharacterized protein n=1 Tax=Leifsonia xyli subsp. xyli TaxID=59736 RepID=A0A1E2SN57_LEIXY|nr:hypothetical protein ATY41_00850 [Leifsonia xyli subsp. xyli]
MGRARGHESREGVDELAGFVQVGLIPGGFGESALDGGRAHQMHRGRGDHLDGGYLCDVAGGPRDGLVLMVVGGCFAH